MPINTQTSLTKMEKALKEYYLPAFNNQIGIEPTAFLSDLKRINVSGNRLVSVAPIGLSGGYGSTSDASGNRLPEHAPIIVERFNSRTKRTYVTIVLTDEAIVLTGDKGAMLNALDTEVRSAYNTAKWHTGRTLFGNGTGILAKCNALGTAGNTITVDDVTRLKPGIKVDFYADGAAVDTTPAVGARQILAVNPTARNITIDGAPITLSAGFITVQKAYGREITGLGSIYDDAITSLYGVSKIDAPFIKPIVEVSDGTIGDAIITRTLRKARNDKNSNIDLLLMGDGAYDMYVDYLRVNNVRNESKDLTITGGFKAISFLFGNKEVAIVNESFVPNDECWGVEKGSFELHTTDWDFMYDQAGAPAFKRISDYACYQAVLACYSELICKNPGGCVRISNCC